MNWIRNGQGVALPLILTCALAVAAALPACGQGQSSVPVAKGSCAAPLNAGATGAPWAPSPDASGALRASFSIRIDTKSPALAEDWRQPRSEALTATVTHGDLKIWGGVKAYALHADRFVVDLYFVNDTKAGAREVTATIANLAGTDTFFDLSTDPWATPTAGRTLLVGGIAPEGIAHITFGVQATGAKEISLDLDLAGTTTSRIATSSSPIAVTPDGREAWAAFADADVVSVIDTASDRRVAQVAVGGRPSGVAVTPDGALALVTCSACNQLVVVDTKTRAIVQRFGEENGIGRDPRNIVLSPDGTRAYISAYVGDDVTALERASDGFRIVGRVAVGRRPVGMAITPDGLSLYVAHFMPRGKIQDNMAWVSVVDTTSLATLPDLELRDDGNLKEAACLRLIKGFDQFTTEQLSFEGTPTQLAGVFMAPGGSDAWVPGLRVGGFPIFEGDVKKIGFDFIALGSNSPAALFPLDTRAPGKARVRRLMEVIDVLDREEPYLACIPFMAELEAVTGFAVPDHPGEVQSPGTILPAMTTPLSETGVIRSVGFTRGGRRALALSYAADELMVLDGATRAPTSHRYAPLSGSNPIGIAITPDGRKGYVVYENSTFASVLDLSAYAAEGALPRPTYVPYRFNANSSAAGQGASLLTFRFLTRSITMLPETPPVSETTQVPLVDADPLDPLTRRGKVLFTSSSPTKYPTLSGSREASCSSCHPNGGNDGTAWGTMEGERRTLGLWGGTGGRGWLHASATHASAEDFARIIVRERLGGTGLSEDDVRALSRYVAFGIPEVQRPAVDNSLAARGEKIFQASCTRCHQGPKHTSGNPDAAHPYGGGKASGPSLFDVGSATPWANAILGQPFANLFPPEAKRVMNALRGDRDLGASDSVQQTLAFSPRPDRKRGSLKAPSLTNVWENAVFFHDAREDSLEGAVRDISNRVGVPLGDDDVRAVVEFLKTL